MAITDPSTVDPNTLKMLPLVPPPNTQALNTKTFVPPPLDGSMRIAEMYDWHAEHSPDHSVFEYSDAAGNVTAIKWPEANRAVHRAGRLMLDIAAQHPVTTSRLPVFAILATVDTITYATTLVGIQRAGFTVFAVSTRNSPAAVAHLLTKTRAEYLLVGSEPAIQELVASSLRLMRESDTPVPHQAVMPLFDDIYLPAGAPFTPLPRTKWSMDDPAVIMHSSGSTAFPKPITWTNYRFLNVGRVPYHNEQDFTGLRFGCHTLAMFHAMGIVQTAFVATAGNILTTLKPQSPAPVPTPDVMLKGVQATKTDLLICVPSFAEEWAQDPAAIAILQKTKGIMYGGGPLAKEAGDKLASAGIPIYTMYGTSEYGIIGMMLPKKTCKDWEYFCLQPGVAHHFIPHDNGYVQLVLPACQFQVPSVVNALVDGVPAFDTNDVFAPHPIEKGWYKMFGRADDQIVHSTGEKTNPGPLEDILHQDPLIQAAVVFGHGRFNCGVIVEPIPEERFDPADTEKLAEFRNRIWPTVERMNAYAPQHSRIFKEMIMVTSPSKPFTYTAKNTTRRPAIINEYAQEIDALYNAVDESAETEVAPPSSWSHTSAKEFVRGVVDRVLNHDLGDNDDIFQNGCDSLEATWIRNQILHALRDTTEVNTRAVPGNFVYQNPTIASLAEFVAALAGPDEAGDSQGRAVASMRSMVERYSQDFPVHVASLPPSTSEVVLVTGTTGSLGCSLLSSLLEKPEVTRVYAVNRKSQVPLAERQRSSLQERGYDSDVIMTSPKLVLLETAVEDERLGLPNAQYEELRNSVTHVIHNAWPVNFNLSLRSFEPSVRGVRHLVDLALASPYPSPAQIVFVSSVGILRNIDLSRPIPETPVEAEVAVGSGYSESKWVSECLLAEATARAGVPAVSVRVGQMTGARSGAWNAAEWFPSLVKSSVYLGCMPQIDSNISWLSVDAAARALIEMRTSTSPNLHLAHPYPTSWESVCAPIAKEFSLQSVPYSTWLVRLEKSGRGLNADAEVEMMRRNPALKIIGFFRDGAESAQRSPEAMGLPLLDVSLAKEAAPSLQTLQQLTAEDALSWVAYWRRVGHLA